MVRENQTEPVDVDRNFIKSSDSTKTRCNIGSIFKFISSLLLPLMLGIFTVVITFQQQKSAQQQRFEDREAARQQREQDQLAAKQLRDLERSLNDERYLNGILDRYIEDMGFLLKENQGSLQTTEFMSILARAKTLNVIRQLDAQRIINVIRFLFEARQLSDQRGLTSIDLSTAELDHIDFRNVAIRKKSLDGISLGGILFYNVTFIRLQMKNINFESANFDTVDLSETKLINVNFSSAIFDSTNLNRSKIRNTTFSSAIMIQTICSHVSFHDGDLSNTILDQVNFSSAILFNMKFISSKLTRVDFSNAFLKDVDFSSAELFKVNFTQAQLQNVTFTSAKLRQVDFSSPIPYNYYQYNVTLTHSILETVNFTNVKFYKVSFAYSEQRDVKFSYAVLASANFKEAKLSNATFYRASCLRSDFTSAILMGADFTGANAKGASFSQSDLSEANFSNANLQKTDLRTTKITDGQLQDAFSIHQAHLNNGTRILDDNLIKNGQPDCNKLFISNWKIQTGSIIIQSSDEKDKICRFILESYLTGAIMSQQIELSSLKHSNFYANSKAILVGQMDRNVVVQLIAIDDKQLIVTKNNISVTINGTYVNLYEHVEELEIVVHFYPTMNPHLSNHSSWCHSLELYIDYGPDIIAPSRIEPMIPEHVQWDQNGEIVIEKWIKGNHTDNLDFPHGLFISDDQSIFIADTENHRIVVKKIMSNKVVTIAGGNDQGDDLHQLSSPTDVLFDNERNCLIICDSGNKRIMEWPDDYNDTNDSIRTGHLLIDDIHCIALTMDDQRSLYISDISKNNVKRYLRGDTNGIIIAGEEKSGSGLHQLRDPSYLFINQERTLYISDTENRRVMKWMHESKQGIIIAGAYGQDNSLNQLSGPVGIWADRFSRIYVVDIVNNRIMCWEENFEQGIVIADRIASSQKSNPIGLFFDRHGHLYITDRVNNVLIRFRMDI